MSNPEQPSEPPSPTPEQLKQANKIAWLVVGLLLSSLAACGVIGALSSNSGNCYEEAGQSILQRNGNKVLSRSDIERYGSEIRNRCD